METASDAIEFLLAGATTVGLGTGLFYDPLAAKRINRGIENYLRTHDFESISDIVGGLDLGEIRK